MCDQSKVDNGGSYAGRAMKDFIMSLDIEAKGVVRPTTRMLGHFLMDKFGLKPNEVGVVNPYGFSGNKGFSKTKTNGKIDVNERFSECSGKT